jgi:benzoylformate decarboxylase
MRALVKKVLDRELSRRDFGAAMLAMGFSAAAIESVWRSAAAEVTGLPADGFEFIGNGGEVLAECLQAAGVEYIFNANSTGQGAFYDALGARPELNLIIALQEGQATSIAQGYELASHKTAALMLPSIGIPNALSNLYNAWKDRSAIAVFSDGQDSTAAGRDGFQQLDDWLQPTEAFTKWRWQVEYPERIGEMVRRAIKLAGTPPGGPVYVRLPKHILRSTGIEQTIYPQSSFTVPMDLSPPDAVIAQAAKLLLEAKAPILNVGAEVTRAGANNDVIELAELLSIPVAQGHSVYGDFPFQHPLFAGFTVGGAPRGLRQADVYLNLGGHMPDRTIFAAPVPAATTVIDARIEYGKIANLYPTDLAIAGGARETTRALIDAIDGLASGSRIRKIRAERLASVREATAASEQRRQQRIADAWDASPMSTERLSAEINRVLDDQAVILSEQGGRTNIGGIDFTPGGRTLIGPTTGYALGWGLGASLGVKIARPDQQVACLIGDGALLFGQVESLWTASRYDIPVIIIVFNNRSYDSERQALYLTSLLPGADKPQWKDMSCYLGDPVVDFVGVARAFDIGGERISAPAEAGPALERAANATREGRPYLIDAVIARRGHGAESTWYPDISIAGRRSRKI